MDKTEISKKLSFLLRHSTEPLYIDLDGGWADVSVVIDTLKKKYPDMNMDILEQIVAEDAKGRYSFDSEHNMIRANQGHSIPDVIIEMEEPDPPEFLFHGTATHFLDSILKEGLKPMSRQYVHLSPDIKTAVEVGKRHGKPVVLVIRAKDLVDSGNRLYRSLNGVWLTKYVPTDFFKICNSLY